MTIRRTLAPRRRSLGARRVRAAPLSAVVLASAGLLLLSCSDEASESPQAPETEAQDAWSSLPEVSSPDPDLAGFPTRQAQYERLCSRAIEDDFLRRLCTTPRPEITSLKELLAFLDLDHNAAFAFTANSTSLVMRSVSSVNPRAIIFPRVMVDNTPPEELNIVSFVRGEPFVEIATRSTAGDYNFYFMVFERACDYEGGCDLASLFTEEIESGWTAYSIYADEELKDTPLDCISCHQPGGHGTPTILRMQEFRSPWLHWFPQKFAQRTPSDVVLLPQFLEAHAVDEHYAGIPIATIETAVVEGSGAHLEELLRAEGQAEQPNVFDPLIEREIAESGESGRWDALYAAFLQGDAISVPFPGLDPTDPTLREAAVRSYVDVVTGNAPRESMQSMNGLFSSEARELLGIVPPTTADGQTVLNVACGRCHNGTADPALVRSAFNVKALDQMSREVKDWAIERLQMDPNDPLVMPPARFGPLPPEAIAKAVEVLQN
jgi:hypothetical protein